MIFKNQTQTHKKYIIQEVAQRNLKLSLKLD